ncbi:MAG: sugar phosphate nucleotidyltransferase [candidate division WOR-3 bacterium]
MEKFLGILCAGGKGKRLGMITNYISKPFVPVYDRPAFLYPLKQMECSKYIDEIIILTREENNEKFASLGYETIIQDDRVVRDMFSGLSFIKKKKKTNRHFVLMPCDNISRINIDAVINLFLSKPEIDIAFCIKVIRDRKKLRDMGVYDPRRKMVYYKPKLPPSPYGVLAPYVVRNTLKIPPVSDAQVLNRSNFIVYDYRGFWFDIGDVESLFNCTKFLRGLYAKR